MTWREQAWAIIREAVRDMPDDTPLDQRIKVVDAARPHWVSASWPRQAWQRARREYLVCYGYQPKTKQHKQSPPLPLFT